MTITPHQASKLLSMIQPFPGGKLGEVYISVSGVRVALGIEPTHVQDMPFYIGSEIVDSGRVAVYVLNREVLERFASKYRGVGR